MIFHLLLQNYLTNYNLNVSPPDWHTYAIIPLFKKVTTQTQTITREFPY